ASTIPIPRDTEIPCLRRWRQASGYPRAVSALCQLTMHVKSGRFSVRERCSCSHKNIRVMFLLRVLATTRYVQYSRIGPKPQRIGAEKTSILQHFKVGKNRPICSQFGITISRSHTAYKTYIWGGSCAQTLHVVWIGAFPVHQGDLMDSCLTFNIGIISTNMTNLSDAALA